MVQLCRRLFLDVTEPPSKFEHRPAIDGLRGIAVAAVVAYHLNAPWLPGGFLGVDVFFVLSGYLITRLLDIEIRATGRVDFPAFWARRARRLLPALLATVLVAAALVRVLRPAPEWAPRRQDALFTIFYSANWHQIATSQDYFAGFIGASPFRHAWSLAIEEQFYLLWPPAFLALSRRLTTRARLMALVALAAISVGVQWLVYDPANPTRAYVGTDARVHELLVGAALAVSMQHWQRHRQESVPPPVLLARWVVGPAAVGVLLFFFAAIGDTQWTYYAGGSLLVALATAALTWAVEIDAAGPLALGIGSRGLAWLGLISYGVYLWHWPVILFMPTLLVRAFGGPGMAVAQQDVMLAALCAVASVVAAALSFYVLERPLRFGRFVRTARPFRVALASTVGSGVVAAASLVILTVPVGLRSQVRTAADCALPACLVVDAGANRPTIAVLGDSIAMSMGPAFEQLARAHGWNFVTGAHNRCTVLHHMLDRPNWQECYDSVPLNRDMVLAYDPQVIVVSDNWIWVDAIDGQGKTLRTETAEHARHVEAELMRAVEQIAAKGAIVVLARLVASSQRIECADPAYDASAPSACVAPDRTPQFDLYNGVIDRVAAALGDRVRVIDFTDVMCPNRVCRASLDGTLVRFDTMHFSTDGARWLAPHLERKLREAGVVFGL